ncbi:D-aminoacyl-tRNA deacylase [Chloroflexota bacterium]
MKVLLQRVAAAGVSVDGKEVGRIGRGLVVFVGVADGDSRKDIDFLVQKTINMRIFTDETDRFNLSLADIGGELLLVSQFTLLADTRKGRRPSFADAATAQDAERLFKLFVDKAVASGVKVSTGRFQQYMQVEIHNDGPVSIMLDSRGRL